MYVLRVRLDDNASHEARLAGWIGALGPDLWAVAT